MAPETTEKKAVDFEPYKARVKDGSHSYARIHGSEVSPGCSVTVLTPLKDYINSLNRGRSIADNYSWKSCKERYPALFRMIKSEDYIGCFLVEIDWGSYTVLHIMHDSELKRDG